MKTVFVFILACFTGISQGQQPYWQQQVNFSIDVSLNDTAHTLYGFETIEYINNSPDTLKFIWFHIWPNAYKSDKTAFSDQLLENGKTNFYFSNPDQKGYINRLDFRVNNITATVEDHPNHIDIIKLILPTPLSPGEKTTITTPFHVKLPFNFSRGGHDGQSYQLTQWYPKPAVYDQRGWHPIPYLDQGEFYSEFGDFEVNITVPASYVVAATGDLKNLDSSSKETKTLRFQQNNVHDFAWFADKRFVVNHDTLLLQSGRVIDVYAYYTRPDYNAWQNAVKFTKRAVSHYSTLVGEYPYNVVRVVEGPESFGGGMEYPTITIISPTSDVKLLDQIIAHEVGHNWFYGILASNERDHPWMDEGINSYYEAEYMVSNYGQYEKIIDLALETAIATNNDQPIDLPSEKFTPVNYGLVVYYKTAQWLRYLETQLGKPLFNQAMQAYYNTWKFKHPQPADFKRSIELTAGRSLDKEFALLSAYGALPNQVRTGTKKAFLFDAKAFKDYMLEPSKNLLVFGPMIGANSYDKVMLGGFITNIKLPPTRFNFFLSPLYATGSRKLRGIGFATYHVYPRKTFQRIDLNLLGSTFTANQFTDNSGKKNFLGFTKIVPGIKFTFKEKEARSPFTKFIHLKSFFIKEHGLRFFRDTVYSGPDTIITDKYNLTNKRRTLHQLSLVIENNRALYPYRGELKLESGDQFIRVGFTGNYFFNYAKGGLSTRVFAGKFFYTGSRTSNNRFATNRYHLNLSGPDGNEDYTYSDYFVGRNHFSGWQSQQMMVRDGAFKVRTDYLAQKVGKTDDWLIAANLVSSIPDAINPFRLLPVKLPVKVFMDIGTYAESWKQDAETDRFLYDAGLCISLFKETFNIYIPLVYSAEFGDYYKSTIAKGQRFWKKISFSIDISNFSFRKLDRNIRF